MFAFPNFTSQLAGLGRPGLAGGITRPIAQPMPVRAPLMPYAQPPIQAQAPIQAQPMIPAQAAMPQQAAPMPPQGVPQNALRRMVGAI